MEPVCVTVSMLLATGWHFQPAQEYATGTGLTAYRFAGKRLLRLFEHKWAEIWGVYGTHAFLYAEGHKTLSAVDLSRHRVTAVAPGKRSRSS